MDALELAMLKEGLMLASQALTKLSSVNNPTVSHISNILLEVVNFGGILIESSNPGVVANAAVLK
jgi:hypothetical protein